MGQEVVAYNVAQLGIQDPVGWCQPGLHPDGSINVLLKSGAVRTVKPIIRIPSIPAVLGTSTTPLANLIPLRDL